MARDHRRLLALYYGIGTLVFWGIDIVLSAPIRASFIGRPGARILYYLGLLGLGALCLGMVSLNFVSLLGYLLPRVYL